VCFLFKVHPLFLLLQLLRPAHTSISVGALVSDFVVVGACEGAGEGCLVGAGIVVGWGNMRIVRSNGSFAIIDFLCIICEYISKCHCTDCRDWKIVESLCILR